LLLLAMSAEAGAQTRPLATPPRPARPCVEHGFIMVNAGAQGAAPKLSDRLEFESNAESGSIDATYPGKTGVLFDGAVGILVRRPLGFAVAVSRSSRTAAAAVTASIPHPFFDDRDRIVDGSAGGISRTETAVHLQAYVDLRPRGGWRVRLFAGPSYFDVEQELVTDVQAREVFPYDTAEFGGATTTHTSGSGIGFHGGIDVARMFTRRAGIGALVRYARASIDLNGTGSRSVSTDGGGLQAAAGLRLSF
jgi:hypothetical protein